MTHMPIASSMSRPAGARPPRRIGIAGLQMPVAAGEDNIPRMARLAAHTKHRFPWVEVMLFPELAVFGADPARAQPLPGDAENRLADIARRNGVWLVPGSLFERRDGAIPSQWPSLS